MECRILGGVKKCRLCGKRIFLQGYDITRDRISNIMDQEKICYECAFWRRTIEFPPDNMEVLGDKCLIIYPHVCDRYDRSITLGGKGVTRWFVKRGLKLIESNDIWLYGTIPERFREQLPPTVFEITQKAYRQFKRNPNWCRARSCMDRYHCYRFDLSLEEESGPFNKIPKKWKLGEEHCGYRLDQSEILSDDGSIKTLKLLANGKND